MRKKLKEKSGLTMVEMLAASLVLALLALMLNTGLQMVMNTYQTMIAHSELELLVSTAVNTLADDLRYAQDVRPINSTDPVDFTYYSDSYGEKTHLVVENGRIVAKSENATGNNTWPVLSTGAYGKSDSYKEYRVEELKITHRVDTAGITFDIHLKIATVDGKSSAERGVTVRCLNPYIPPAGGT